MSFRQLQLQLQPLRRLLRSPRRILYTVLSLLTVVVIVKVVTDFRAPSCEETETINEVVHVHHRYYSSIPIDQDTRRLVLLATHRINELVDRLINEQLELIHHDHPKANCSKWWANPLEVRQDKVVDVADKYEDHSLEFLAHSTWETAVTFRTVARVRKGYDHQNPVEFVADQFIRVHPSNLSVSTCLAHVNSSQLCSCPPPAWTGSPSITRPSYDPLPAWSVSGSFMVGEYLRLDSPPSLFNMYPLHHHLHCGLSVPMLIMIISAISHFDERQAIRQTFGSKAELHSVHSRVRKIPLIFVTGRASIQDQEPGKLEGRLWHEARTHEDIVQGNFEDTYQNLTLKHLTALAYVYYSCSKPLPAGWNETKLFDGSSHRFHPPAHILKADDDYFLNVDKALALVAANPQIQLMGGLICKAGTIRDSKSKYFVPCHMHPAPEYPPYIEGGTVLFRSEIIPRLLATSLSVPIVNSDDVYVWGMLAKSAGIKKSGTKLIRLHDEKEKDPEERYRQLNNMVSFHMDNASDFFTTWKLFTSKNSSRNLLTNNDDMKGGEFDILVCT